MAANPKVRAFFHEPTFTVSYLVWDPATKVAAIIDSVLDFDQKSGRTATESAQAILDAIREEGVRVEYLLETHAHADHLSAAPFLKQATGAPIVIGEHIKSVQKVFKDVFNLSYVTADGRPFDKLVRDGETLKLGELEIKVLHTPGHTPACVSYLVGDAVFVGDTLFMPDYGTARAIFRAAMRARSIVQSASCWRCRKHARFPLPRLQGAGPRDLHLGDARSQTRRKMCICAGVTEDQYVAMREARDKTLEMPVLILPSIQVNIQAGELPPAEENGVRYLKLPLDAL
jgi:glyoxylase-like metal-dependent hydrolase (beta-lactamase superfamily II)